MIRKNWQIVIPLLLLALFSFSNSIVNLWTDWHWFEETGYPVLFTRSFFTQIWLTCAFAAVFFAYVYGNIMLARTLARKSPHHGAPVASREHQPSSKKLSLTPIGLTPSG